MDEQLKLAKEKLKQFHQEQVLIKYDTMSQENKEKLVKQILSLDFKQLEGLYEMAKKEVTVEEAKVEPIAYVDKEKMTNEEKEEYTKLGVEAIKSGELAAVTMAGGQGTRLGHKGPKGTFDLGLASHKSIFEILCDTLKKAKEDYGVVIPWYLMTSKENNEETIQFFESHNYFGYPKESVHFFMQGELPMLLENGHIVLKEDGTIKEAADGHGGVFESMTRNGVVEQMKQDGIKWVFIGGVDNVLVKMVDPIFMGLTIKQHALAAGKSVVKANPSERVGVFCKKNGKPSVIEYTEISKEMAEATDKNGELVYGESHILCNMFHIQVLEELGKNKLPYHKAFKKTDYFDENGNWVVAEKPNAYKFETFLFDAFSKIDTMTIMRVKREEEFAPVKNAEGTDSPETARALYKAFYGIKE